MSIELEDYSITNFKTTHENSAIVGSVEPFNFDTIYGSIWSPITFSGNRSKENFQSCNLLVADIDNNLTIDEAQDLLGKFGFAHIICTTRNHGLPKGGSDEEPPQPACDRYRVIVFPETKILNIDDYDKAFNQLNVYLLGNIDPRTKIATQFYFPFSNNIKIINLDGETFKVQKKFGIISDKTLNFLKHGAASGERHDALVRAAFDFHSQKYPKYFFEQLCGFLDSTYTDKQAIATIDNCFKSNPRTPFREFTKSMDNQTIYEKYEISLNKNGIPINNIDNISKIISKDERFCKLLWFDEFHNKLFHNLFGNGVSEWSEVDTLNLTVIFQRDLGFTNTEDKKIEKAVLIAAHKNIKNEPKDWLLSLKWDGISRLDTFLMDGFGTEDTEYFRKLGNNWLVSMAARIIKPGTKVDSMPILEGPQGKLKSTSLEILGGKWFIEPTEEVNQKDFLQSMQGNILVEIGELGSFQKKDVNFVKRFITRTRDRFRWSYDKFAKDYPRRCVFVGTTNEDCYLSDATGARRFFPIRIGIIDTSYLKQNRDQLFAEACVKYKNNYDFWSMPEEETLSQQSDRYHADVWQDSIEDYLIGKTETTVVDILKNCLNISEQAWDQACKNRVSRTLTALGFIGKPVKHMNKTKRVYKRQH